MEPISVSGTDVSLWTFTGLCGVDLCGQTRIDLPDGFLLSAKTPQLSAALNAGYLGDLQKLCWVRDIECFFCLQRPYLFSDPWDSDRERFQDGLMALQIIKPVHTLGLIFQQEFRNGSPIGTPSVEQRPEMMAGDWARMRRFDGQLITQLNVLLPEVIDRMEKGSVEQKNAVFLLQHSLEHFHPLIKGLFSVMGLEALFDSKGRDDFKKKLCERSGESTRVFPDWNSPSIPPPQYTVGEVALHLYTLRSKLAHGQDLRKAAQDRNVQVDLMKSVELIEQLGPRPRAVLLSEAAIYILCSVLRKELEAA